MYYQVKQFDSRQNLKTLGENRNEKKIKIKKEIHMHPNERCVHCPLMQCAVFIVWFAIWPSRQ